MHYRDMARADLLRDEGLKFKPYRCTAGKLTIGCGRNIEDNGISHDEAMLMLDNDLARAERDAANIIREFDSLTDARKACLVNMAFNLGAVRLAGFARLRSAIAIGDFDAAADEMLASAWATQVGQRAHRLAKMMREG